MKFTAILPAVLITVVSAGSAFAHGKGDEPDRDKDEAPATPVSDSPSTVGTPQTPESSVTATVDLPKKRGSALWFAEKLKGSTFFFDQSVTPDTIYAGAQQSAIPSYQWWFSLRPRWNFRKDLVLKVRMDLTVEWLNAVDTTYLREAQFGDIWLDLQGKLKPFGGIKTSIGARVIVPTSKEAIAATTVLRAGPTIGFLREFEFRRGGALELSLGAYGLYNFVTHTSPGTQGDFSCTSTAFTPTSCSQSSGSLNTQFQLVVALGGTYHPVSRFGIGLNYIIIDGWAYNTPDAKYVDQAGGVSTAPRAGDDTRFRQQGWFLATVDYDATKWLTLSLGYFCLRPILNPDGHYGDPFYQPGGDTRVFFTMIFNIDHIIESAATRKSRGNTSAVGSNAPPMAPLSVAGR